MIWWWFQQKFWKFIPIFGEIIQFDSCFFKGLGTNHHGTVTMIPLWFLHSDLSVDLEGLVMRITPQIRMPLRKKSPRYINIHMVVFFHCHLSFFFFLSKSMVFWSFQIFNKNVFLASKASKPASWGSRLRCGQASRCPFLVVFGCVPFVWTSIHHFSEERFGDP